MLSKDFKEKRDYIRMQINSPITIIYGPQDKKIQATCNDLSGTGMQITTDHKFEVGSSAKAHIAAAGPHHASLDAHIRFTRIGEKNGRDITYGVTIESIE